MQHRDEYIDGLQEFLDELEEKLVALSRCAGSAEGPPPGLVHSLFRTAHNMKSSFSALDKQESARLVHHLENLFDAIRNGFAMDPAETGSIGLSVVDALHDNLFAEQEDTRTVDLLVNLLDGIRSRETAGMSRQAIGLDAEESHALRDSLAGGRLFYQLNKQLAPGISREDFAELPILEDIAEIGSLICSRPTYDELRLLPEPVVSFYFASPLAMEEVQDHLFDPLLPVDPSLFSPVAVEAAADQSPVKTALGTPRAIKVLLLEDDFTSRLIIQRVLTGICEVHVCINGFEGLQALEAACSCNEPYALILLDLFMPRMNGGTFLREKSRLEERFAPAQSRKTPVIITSSLPDTTARVGQFSNDFQYFLKKPIDAASLLKTMLLVLHEA